MGPTGYLLHKSTLLRASHIEAPPSPAYLYSPCSRVENYFSYPILAQDALPPPSSETTQVPESLQDSPFGGGGP